MKMIFVAVIIFSGVLKLNAQTSDASIAHKWIIQSITVNGASDSDRYPVNNDVMQFNADHTFHSIDNTYSTTDDGTWKSDGGSIQVNAVRNGENKTYNYKIISCNTAQLTLQFVNNDGEIVVMTLKAS